MTEEKEKHIKWIQNIPSLSPREGRNWGWREKIVGWEIGKWINIKPRMRGGTWRSFLFLRYLSGFHLLFWGSGDMTPIWVKIYIWICQVKQGFYLLWRFCIRPRKSFLTLYTVRSCVHWKWITKQCNSKREWIAGYVDLIQFSKLVLDS